MAAFVNLDDSPMFQKEISAIAKMADELKDRCQRLFNGSQKFVTALGEACNADTVLADSLEAFGGGQDDPISVSIGGPVMSMFVNSFRELASYKELLRSQVEHVLVDRLTQFMDVDLQDALESRKRLDKAVYTYDQSRDKYVSLKKNARGDIVEELEEHLQNSKSAYERSRFNLVRLSFSRCGIQVSGLMNIEAKKKYEFLESMSAVMDAHLRYFKQGYELFRQVEPFVHQVLTYAQQSKEHATIEQDKLAKRIQEFRTQSELDSIQASSNLEPSTSGESFAGHGISSYKNVEGIVQSSTNGEVQILKQGYLLKRSSSSRGDWKRRFFVLDSQGSLFYYRNKGIKGVQHRSTASADYNTGVFARFRTRHNRAASFDEGGFDCCRVNLQTSTLKMDSDNTDLRLCFRIISPSKTYTLQAENAADRMDWVNKISGAIASLLNFQLFQQSNSGKRTLETKEAVASRKSQELENYQNSEDDSVSRILREIPGNELCAECSAHEPDWASLNLGILLCIECSGVHRNLGVHISKVRSLTFDVKVWEPTVLDLFRALGNVYSNSLWEGLLLLENKRIKESNVTISVTKPGPKDSTYSKEMYIHAKYVEKALVVRDATESFSLPNNRTIWLAVKTNNLREVYRCIVISDKNIVNTIFDEVAPVDLHHQINDPEDHTSESSAADTIFSDPESCQRITDSNDPRNCFQGCSLLHLACYYGNTVMLELLLQFGADINWRDFHGRTPLHHCIAKGDYPLAKFLLRRGASPAVKDGRGLSVLERAMEIGAISDEELFVLLAET
ncbi:ADP-ribosylation factor GTPase-activating protein AGD2 [Linum grandiflorum]